jgi:hypothetical protein
VTPYQLDIDYPVDVGNNMIVQQEIDIFIPDAKFLKKFFSEAKRNRSIQASCKGYIHYAYFDSDH